MCSIPPFWSYKIIDVEGHVIYFQYPPPPQETPCWEYPPTRKHILFLNENISLIREYYMNVNTYRIVSTTVWTLQAKKLP